MKTVWLLFFVGLSQLAPAQDTIYTASGDRFAALVETVTADAVKYRLPGSTNGPLYAMPSDDVAAIRYADGVHEDFSIPLATTAPGAMDEQVGTDPDDRAARRAFFRELLGFLPYLAIEVLSYSLHLDHSPAEAPRLPQRQGHYGKR